MVYDHLKIKSLRGLLTVPLIMRGQSAVRNNSIFKVGCVFAMVSWSEFRMAYYRVDDYREDAPNFNCKGFHKIPTVRSGKHSIF